MMFKTRAVLLGVLVLFVASGIASATASASGPYWRVGGLRLESGSKSLKLQAKGTIVLSAQLGNIVEIVVECASSKSEGATIEGDGGGQGQGKGRLIFTQCRSNWPHNCRIVEPVTTSQLKLHLGTDGGQSKYAVLYEPTEGRLFLWYRLADAREGETCLVAGEEPVGGTVAAEVVPREIEGQEMSLFLPEEPVSTVFLGQEEKKVDLLYGENQMKFSASYGARLDGGEKFGVFGK
jgi:hypothetical protein